ncbi:TolC family protein [Marinomonas sp. THO17]|uniref:TolC family protein n=1 Tax=Marinomonas sp. THO17 TaxID=3149048 RepID=UPI00336BB6F5
MTTLPKKYDTITKTKTLTVGVKNAYADTYLAVRALDQAKDAVKDAKAAYEDAKQKVADGKQPKNDLDFYKANLAVATANVASATTAVAAYRERPLPQRPPVRERAFTPQRA